LLVGIGNSHRQCQNEICCIGEQVIDAVKLATIDCMPDELDNSGLLIEEQNQ